MSVCVRVRLDDAGTCVRVRRALQYGFLVNFEIVWCVHRHRSWLALPGSERYPDENEYGAYLAAAGGYSNAFTDQDNTYVCRACHCNMKREWKREA